MPWFDNKDRYGTISLILHWLIAVLVLIMLATGWGREIVPRPWGKTLMLVHKSTGVSILALAAFRVFWRLRNTGPGLPDSLHRLIGLAARTVHILLYGMMLGMPLTGWLMSSAAGRPVLFLGRFPLPSLTAPNKPLAHSLESVHETGAYIFAALIALHIAAALWHVFVLKDGLLRRMLPLKEKRSRP